MNGLNTTLTIAPGDVFSKVFILGNGMSDVPQSIVIGKGARVDIVLVVLPGADCTEELQLRLCGEGAEASISGIYICDGSQKVDISVDMFHDVPRCNSRQLFKGMAAGKSRVNFYGKIVVAHDAQKTEAYQENHNLLLSDDAKVDTKPQLEIYADDVKCSHGATVGRLNEEEQFYMRSRGIPEEEAKVLQMISFVSPVIENICDSDLRENVRKSVEDALRKL